MKTYVKPSIYIIKIETFKMIAASGDTTNVVISDTEYDGTFSAPEMPDLMPELGPELPGISF